jgi:hypothetical protein
MKNKWNPLVIIAVIVFVVTACKKSETKWTSSESAKDFCQEVVDSLGPLSGVLIEGSVRGINGHVVFSDTTDLYGKRCKIPNSIDIITFTKQGYIKDSYHTPCAKKVTLQKPAYINLHIRNDLPSAGTDFIKVWYYTSAGLSQTHNFQLNGVVEDFRLLDCDPRKKLLWTDGTSTTWNEVTINVAGGDTMDLNIFY